MNALFTGIYAKLAGSDLNTAIGGRLYLNIAPQRVSYPYVVYSMVSSMLGWDFAHEQDEFILQFNIYSQSKSSSEAGTILGHLKTLYDDCSLTVAGYTHYFMQREQVISLLETDIDPPIQGYMVEYRILLES